MSWVNAVSHSGEDVFDESAVDLNLQSKEWNSNMKKRLKDGYVDGVSAGEEAALQLGFDLGFREGAAQTVAVGRLKGIASAISCWCQIQHPENPVPACVTELLQRVSQHEDKITEGIRKALENSPPSVSDISESMEVLEVEQADQGCCGERCEMDQDAPHQPRKLCSGSTDCSSYSDEGLSLLLQHCMDVVSELGLPHELVSHIQELKNM
ncbi:hypothetical protein F2P81_021828 [Scophthalmus maximus]|uniref:Essential protein Yae1 N-terminal domain-containing protein n=2 Tax=Scophthalmus maximus TaxID=52904 RepID=A0A6A4RWW4_SCOMX|nr:hypothetical protein F2P81_021828 [Scophthalmus maximus]